MLKWLNKIVGGDLNERELSKLRPIVERVNAVEEECTGLTEAELRAKTDEFRQRIEGGESLDDLLPEAFACVRETSKRTTGMRHFDVQIIGGAALHAGKIAEMRTGEGKTLVATLPLYLNALLGKGAHLVTVNDYLAKRDAQWMGPIYDSLGLSVGIIQHESAFLFDRHFANPDPRLANLRPVPRREAYQADITYGTNNEFGFDYLRDNMVHALAQKVQRDMHFAIVDEVDNILIDEARTPLIISGQGAESTELYYTFARIVPRLQGETDYNIDEKLRVVTLTPEGMAKTEKALGLSNLYDPENYHLTHYLEQALKAQFIFKRDRDYVLVKEGQVIDSHDRDAEIVIVDEFTGRLMFGRRYSEGLHQAIEAKENVKIQRESQTLATITFQNYFRMYSKLAGMTGTASTEREEFFKIYRLEVVEIPTNRENVREDRADLVYKNEDAKFRAVVTEIHELHQQGCPVLVGTVSIEKSERLSEMLSRRGIPHQVLNAKYHEREAAIIAQAGRSGSVTLATNMAGRGVDILLGGNPAGLVPEVLKRKSIKGADDPALLQEAEAEAKAMCEVDRANVVAKGGLQIIGTERHEARRIDNQLRGRAGRQGDPGSSRFFVSLDDDIMRRFGGSSIAGIMDRLRMEEDMPIEHPLVSKAIENAQTKVEGHNFDIRKHVVQYDDVMNKQREVIYAERHKVLANDDLKTIVQDMIARAVSGVVEAHLVEHFGPEEVQSLLTAIKAIFPLPPDLDPEDMATIGKTAIEEYLQSVAEQLYEAKEQDLGSDSMRQLERLLMLTIIDRLWVEHLTGMDDMREGIGLRAYGQRDPLVEYQAEGYRMFQELMATIESEVVHTIYHVTIHHEPPAPAQRAMRTNREETAKEPTKTSHKIGRNDPCPCGSGKKYKKCCGK